MVRRAQGQAEAGKLRAPNSRLGVSSRRLRPGRAANDNQQPFALRLGKWPLLALMALVLAALGLAGVLIAS